MRLIDANALEKDIRAYADNKAYCGHIELANGILKAVGRIDEAPTVDAVPVVHGRWELHPRHPGFDRCSECKDCIIGNDWADGKKWNYCPNCGAKMDGKDNAE